ncbi:type-F conjugative transfer system pilin chaperone TraQ [Salmonella enterica subsp. enterica serovar Lexington]|nr:type-F conjugative transfer system pilin chaperone TraQ [Salmonella enterica subsp. enterica serovar Lexington]EAO2118144.1 type-F conjugative transfer system pilin chaperone TraQ [Salmonella enterica]ECM3796740.1 type-F conjugative transfer system pilin chaperone TraQ [Salmonella enterica subsp. enterica serovar Newport]EDV1074532.1 type-F conjugative transfer system pilin chaperone TraQ [Salmonella enterica subsp. enterica]EDW0192048.1 type-F conjugative transfer system pilin chaperone Tra
MEIISVSEFKCRLSWPDITGLWIFSLGVWFHIVGGLVYRRPWMAFVLAELIAAVLVLWGAYQMIDTWIARVSREEREALEARQASLLANHDKEAGHESSSD